MSTIFLGQLYEESELESLKQICKRGISKAHYLFQWNFIEALKQNDKDVKIVRTLPVANYPIGANKLFLYTTKRKNNTCVGFINLPIIKHIMRRISAKKALLQYLDKENELYNGSTIVIYDCYIPFIKAALDIKGKDDKVIVIVPDIPGKLCVEYQSYNFLTKIYKNIEFKKLKKCIKNIDGAVVLAEDIATKLRLDKYLVVETITSSDYCLSRLNDTNERHILYAGELSENVGIKKLIEAFKDIDDKNVYLDICGVGPLSEYVKIEAQKIERLSYLGYLYGDDMINRMSISDVFVNPRDNSDEFSKYSFPSKNIEYLKQGKPVVAYRLSSMPDEYNEYIIYPADSSVESLRECMLKACYLEWTIKDQKRQIDFVINNKSVNAQGTRINEFIEEL